MVGITINSMHPTSAMLSITYTLSSQRTPSQVTVSTHHSPSPSANVILESAQVPGGIRLGTSAVTSRDMKEEDIKVVASFLHRAVEITTQLQKESGSKLIKDLLRVATDGNSEGSKALKQLGKDVRAFSRKWPLPGVDVKGLKRPAGIEEED